MKMGNGNNGHKQIGLVGLLKSINPSKRGEIFKEILMQHNGNTAKIGAIPTTKIQRAPIPLNHVPSRESTRKQPEFVQYDPNGNHHIGQHITFNLPLNAQLYLAQGKIVGVFQDKVHVDQVYVPEIYNKLPGKITLSYNASF